MRQAAETDIQGKNIRAGDPSEGWGLSRAKRAKKRRHPPGSRVRKTLLPRVIELLREADNPKFDQKSAVNGYRAYLSFSSGRG